MTSASRAAFLTGLRAMYIACDESAVRAHDDVGLFLRRGMIVAAFNLLETFIDERVQELAPVVNSGVVQFIDLPDRLQRRSISQTLEVATARLRRTTIDTPDMRAFSKSVGDSLGVVGGGLALSPYTWLWTGSNASASELSTMFSFFQVDQPWSAARDLTSRLNFPATDPNGDPIDLQDDFKSLAAERHLAAHVASHPVTPLWLRAVPDRILRLGVAADLLCSFSALLFHHGDSDMLAGKRWQPNSSIGFRFVRKRKTDFAEFVENGTRATRRDTDLVRLRAGAATRCGRYDALIMQDETGALVSWTIPAVD